jgi:hypothetical protein
MRFRAGFEWQVKDTPQRVRLGENERRKAMGLSLMKTGFASRAR